MWGFLMVLALLWLTVSLPFVNDARQLLSGEKSLVVASLEDNPVEGSEEANPIAGSVEEKAPSNASVLEEYLHHYDEAFSMDNPQLSHLDNRSYDLYIAFHGELLSPPPEALLS